MSREQVIDEAIELKAKILASLADWKLDGYKLDLMLLDYIPAAHARGKTEGIEEAATLIERELPCTESVVPAVVASAIRSLKAKEPNA